jgi:D-alanine-D-alanine ligase
MDHSSQIYVLCGGFSGEREVSLRSGKNVHAALLRLGYKQAKLFDINNASSLKELAELKIAGKIDAAILMTHGNYGEDGCIQGYLELLQIPYSGSKVMASAVGMNKIQTKAVLKASSLPVLASAKLSEFGNGSPRRSAARDDNASLVLSQGKTHGYIAKPINDGSSVGIVKVNSEEELLKLAANDNASKYFVEPFIKGTEVTTSIIPAQAGITNSYTDSDLASLPILELRPKKEFYDYEAKYTPGMTEFVLPAEIDSELTTQVHKYALAAYRAVGCSGFARVDFIIDMPSRQPYILEINTLPGMTDTSDLPAQAKAAGISYDQLVLILVNSLA